jgi:hypothetical protein
VPRSERRPIARLASAVATGALAAVAIYGCGGGSGSGTTTTRPETTVTHQGSTTSHAGAPPNPAAPPKARTPKGTKPPKHLPPLRGHRHTGTIPARMLGPDPQTPFSTNVLSPVRNGWQVSDHRMFTAVYAGASGSDRSAGALAIFRQNFIQVTQKLKVVKVAGAGAVKITRAPLGKGVETSAQRHGNLHFTSSRGITGTLHLKNDTISLG